MTEFGAGVSPKAMQEWAERQVAALRARRVSETARAAHPAGKGRATREIEEDGTESRA